MKWNENMLVEVDCLLINKRSPYNELLALVGRATQQRGGQKGSRLARDVTDDASVLTFIVAAFRSTHAVSIDFIAISESIDTRVLHLSYLLCSF